MTPASAVIAQARECIDTRWVHQGRQRGHGLDCVGLLVVAFGAAGASAVGPADYPRLPHTDELRLHLRRHLIERPRGAAWAPADVLLLRYDQPQHLALWTGSTIIHAYLRARRVVETRLDEADAERVVAVYRHPEVEGER